MNGEVQDPGLDGRRGVLALLLACATLTVMAGATISPSLPGLLVHFSDVAGAETLVPFILTVPGLAIAISAPLCGVLVDRVDPKRVLMAAIGLYIVAGSSGLWLDGLVPIIGGRALLGVAVGGLMTASTTLIADIFSGPERGRVLGYQASAMGFGGVVFILAGSLLADMSWRGPFAVYLVPLALWPLVWRFVPAQPPAGPVAQGVAAERFPMAFAGMLYASAFAVFLIFYMVPTQLPFLVRELGAEQASTAGYAMTLVTFASAAMSLWYGRLRARMAPGVIAVAGFAVLAGGYVVLSRAGGLGPVFVICPVIGLALGVLMPNHINWLMARVPAPMRGRANGFMTMAIFSAQFMSAFAGAALVGFGGLGAAFWGMAILSAAVAAGYAVRHAVLRGPARAAA